MKKNIRNIVKKSFATLLLGIPCSISAGEQTIQLGGGYKYINAASHNNKLHSGRYFALGYGYTFGNKTKNHFQFQVSNSNKEVLYEIPYVSANTNLDIYQEFNFPFFRNGKFMNYSGFYFGNSFDLNYFPIVDRKNLIWENHLISGLSIRNIYQLSIKSSVNLNLQIPIYSFAFSNSLNRFDGARPQENLSLWETMDHQIGFADQLFKPNFEIGYLNNITEKVKVGVFYQTRCNWYERQNGNRTNSIAHVISLKIIY